jgi:type I restriction enzyme, S subunit
MQVRILDMEQGDDAEAWPRLPLSPRLAEVVRGVTYSREDAKREPVQGFVPLLRAGNIGDGQLDIDHDLVWVPAERVTSTQYLRPNDIVVCTSSGSPAVVGKAAILERHFSGSFGAFNAVVRTRPGVESRFLHHWFQSIEYLSWRDTQARGANIQNLRHSELAALRVPMPPPSEQHRIVEILDQTDHLRRLRAEADAKADQVLAALYRRLFLDPASNWPTEALGTHLRKRKGCLQSGPFGSHLHNADFVDSGPVRVVGIDNVLDGEFLQGRDRRITAEKYAQLKKYTLEAGDILVTVMGTVGRSCVFPNLQEPAICTKHVYRIQVDERLDSEYVSASIRFAPAARYQLAGSTTGQIVAGITSENIRRLELLIPPRELQDRFAAHALALAQQRTDRRHAAAHLDSLSQLLSRSAFAGTLTASWREAHMTELLQEMERQAKALAEVAP